MGMHFAQQGANLRCKNEFLANLDVTDPYLPLLERSRRWVLAVLRLPKRGLKQQWVNPFFCTSPPNYKQRQDHDNHSEAHLSPNSCWPWLKA